MPAPTATDILTQNYNAPPSILFHNGDNEDDNLPIFQSSTINANLKQDNMIHVDIILTTDKTVTNFPNDHT